MIVKIGLCCVFSVCFEAVAVAGIAFAQFSIKTAYSWAHNSSGFTKNDLFTISGPLLVCSVARSRHGTRFPEDGDEIDISLLSERMKYSLSFSAVPAFINWTNPLKVEQEKQLLAAYGEQEHEAFGTRAGARLSNSFTGENYPSNSVLGPFDKQRTITSAIFFRRELLNITDLSHWNKTDNPFPSDRAIRLYDYCERTEDDEDKAEEDYDTFKYGEKVRQMRDSGHGLPRDRVTLPSTFYQDKVTLSLRAPDPRVANKLGVGKNSLLLPPVCVATVVGVDIPFDQFSTKTAYGWAHNLFGYTKNDLFTISVPEMVCSAIHVSSVARHGTRFPGDDDMMDISLLFERLKTSMNFSANPAFINWTNPFKVEQDKLLAERGQQEHKALGERLGIRLSNLFKNESNLSKLAFLSSDKQRTRMSAAFFRRGLLNATGLSDLDTPDTPFHPAINDRLIRFYDYCERYKVEVDDNAESEKEYNVFKAGDKVQQVRERMASKLGVDKDILQPGDVDLIYAMCAFETAIYQSSPWCTLLEKHDLDILEYLSDLEEYYEKGYGYDINWQQTCPLMSDIFQRMKKAIEYMDNNPNMDNGEGFIIGQFDFGHSSTIGTFMTALGLFNDSIPLRADNYDTQHQRLFRSSVNSCLGANVVIVLYRCTPTNQSGNKRTDYYVKTLVNEKSVMLPACNDMHCTLQQVENYYSDLINRCNFKELCEGNAGSRAYLSNTFLLSIVLISIFKICSQLNL